MTETLYELTMPTPVIRLDCWEYSNPMIPEVASGKFIDLKGLPSCIPIEEIS